MAEERVVLFLDSQNVYKGARDVLYNPPALHTDGQVDPMRLGAFLVKKQVTRQARILHEVRIYTGRPSASKQSRAYGAHMRQCAAWERAGVKVVHRPLRYPRGWPKEPPEEKGIDVQIAIDFVMMRLRDEYDVGILFSTDTDLLPALEAACELAKEKDCPLPEVSAWGKEGEGRSRLRVKSDDLRCHWLQWGEYVQVSDRTDYNVRPASKR